MFSFLLLSKYLHAVIGSNCQAAAGKNITNLTVICVNLLIIFKCSLREGSGLFWPTLNSAGRRGHPAVRIGVSRSVDGSYWMEGAGAEAL